MKALTVRNVDARLASALTRETKRRGTSLNQTVLDVLRRGLGIDQVTPRTNGLEKLAGTWTAEDLEEFEANVAMFEAIDPELWR
jgi:plasmid stability protein